MSDITRPSPYATGAGRLSVAEIRLLRTPRDNVDDPDVDSTAASSIGDYRLIATLHVSCKNATAKQYLLSIIPKDNTAQFAKGNITDKSWTFRIHPDDLHLIPDDDDTIQCLKTRNWRNSAPKFSRTPRRIDFLSKKDSDLPDLSLHRLRPYVDDAGRWESVDDKNVVSFPFICYMTSPHSAAAPVSNSSYPLEYDAASLHLLNPALPDHSHNLSATNFSESGPSAPSGSPGTFYDPVRDI